MKTFRCSFCGRDFPLGIGIMYVKVDGTVLYFCSGKCRKNALLGRDPKKLKWVTSQKRRGERSEGADVRPSQT